MNPANRTKKGRALSPKAPPQMRAFTLVELLALICVLALLALVATPALTKTKPNTRALQCLSNQRRLIAAWQLYADDNTGKTVISTHGGLNYFGTPGPYAPTFATGWEDWSLRPDNTNSAILLDPRYSSLATYLNGEFRLYKCPADTYLSPAQRNAGWVERVRSYAGDIYVGEGNAEAGPIDAIYSHIRKLTEFRFPGPSETWEFCEEHPDSINDTGFFPPHQSFWIDMPAPFHRAGSVFSMADGHAELHLWQASLGDQRAQYFDTSSTVPPAVTIRRPADADIHWGSYHSPRVSNRSY